MARPLFLIGFMAAGKTSVGRALAAQTGRRFIDLDDAIAAMGEPVASLVARDEPEFRRREAAALAQLIAEGGDPIIATGGGAAAYGDNLQRMRAAGAVIALGVDLDEARKRAEGGPSRPLLANADQLAKQRAPFYRRAHAVVDTTYRPIDDVVGSVASAEHWAMRDNVVVELGERTYPVVLADRAIVEWHESVSVRLDEPQSPAAGFTAFGVFSQSRRSSISNHSVNFESSSRSVVITDRNVAHFCSLALAKLEVLAIEPGEASKSFEDYQRLCTELVAKGLDRGSNIYAVGGGVVGDLAGFVAATLYRGIGLVQFPTTIVAMTDSAVGGKTAIDLPAGKNLVGAFYQPQAVICNLWYLQSLPDRERRAGFGELWKYALLDGPDLWRAVDACSAWGKDGGTRPQELREMIRACIAYKAAIVSRDEREVTGQRALLNLGHTIGHAIESASGLHHGEAVGLGLIAAARVSAAVGGADQQLEMQITEALRKTGLPHELGPYLTEDVLARIQVDKKRIGDKLRFILVREVGSCEPAELAVTEIQRILRAATAP